MIDISIINTGDKTFSVKSIINFIDSSSINLKVLTVNEISRNSGTSFVKLKTVFDRTDDEFFNSSKYSILYDKLIKFISNKYKITMINFLQ